MHQSRLEDQTGLLTATERGEIERSLVANAVGGGAELIVLLVDSVPGREFRSHAVRERQQLSSDHHNSILLVVAVGDRHAEIATAPKYNDLFDSSSTDRLLRQAAVPHLRNGQLARGIMATLDAIRDRLINGSVADGAGRAKRFLNKVLIGVFVALGLVIAGGFGFQYYSNHTCRGCGSWGTVKTAIIEQATSSYSGTKEHTFHCNECLTNYTWQTSYSYSDSSSSSSDSSSGGSSSSDGGGGVDY